MVIEKFSWLDPLECEEAAITASVNNNQKQRFGDLDRPSWNFKRVGWITQLGNPVKTVDMVCSINVINRSSKYHTFKYTCYTGSTNALIVENLPH